MNSILVDTNVLIYAKDVSSIHHQASMKILQGDYRLFLCSKNLLEYYSVVTKGDEPLTSPANALLDLEEFASLAEVLFPTEISHQKLVHLIGRYHPKGLRIHDFEIAAIALAHGIDKIATFNQADFRQISEIEIVLPVY